MARNKANIAILGDGGWGTTLAVILQQSGHRVCLWGAFPEYVSFLDRKRVNTRFLPGVRISGKIQITSDLGAAVTGRDLVVLAVPSEYMRSVLRRLSQNDPPSEAIYLSVTKGIENSSLMRMSQVVRSELGNVKIAVLSGPTIAHEVSVGIPTTAVVASNDPVVRKHLQNIFMTERLRIYTNDDVTGVELGGSLKNVIAIACGISDGLGFGANTKAAILARGLSEIGRLGKVMGAKAQTFSGLSGLGDLVTTCVSQYSRNRFVGEQIGRGKTLRQIRSRMRMIAEGVPTAKSAYELGRKYKVETPIIREVYQVLYKNKSPFRAVKDLMTRAKREE